MKKIWIHSLFLVLFLLGTTTICEAKVKLPRFVSDGMVLQRGQKLTIWGTADSGEAVNVKFLKKEYKTTADEQGKWQVELPSLKPGGPYTMTINDITIKDILVGDVWLCSGQSNMELPVVRVLELFRDEIEKDSNPMIHHIKVPWNSNLHRTEDDILPTQWEPLTPKNALSFSALAYFFAKDIYAKTKVPVGIINSCLSGSPIEAWISEEGLKSFPVYLNDKRMYESDQLRNDLDKMEAEKNQAWFTALYRGDNGIHESIPWYADNYNNDEWSSKDLFSTDWSTDGLNNVNGSHWLRREFHVPEPWVKEKAVLYLGTIRGGDSTYVNGKFLGTTGDPYTPRVYSIPKEMLRAGTNNITVRIISCNGKPYVVKEKPYKIVFEGGETIKLEGEWKYRQGANMLPMGGRSPFILKPEGLYNAMIAPFLHYGISGVIWYQGEANTGRYNEYASLLEVMIDDWRQKWEVTDLPFYVVELADFLPREDIEGRKMWAKFREAQAEVANTVDKVRLIKNSDLGEWNDIHPLDKKTVGKRVSEAVWNDIQKRH